MEHLTRASTLELLIELMYEGKGQIVPALLSFEPILQEDICAVLASRHGINFGTDFDAWFTWFEGNESPGLPEEKDVLSELWTFKRKIDPLFERAHRNRNNDES